MGSEVSFAADESWIPAQMTLISRSIVSDDISPLLPLLDASETQGDDNDDRSEPGGLEDGGRRQPLVAG